MKEKRLHDDKIELIHVTKKFGQELVLKEVNLTLEQGRVYGIVGNNGSGKTVLMKCICGFLIPTTGLIQVFGSSIGQDVDFPESLGVIIETPGFLTQSDRSERIWKFWLACGRKSVQGRGSAGTAKRSGWIPALKKPVGKLFAWHASAAWDRSGNHGRSKTPDSG